MKARTLQIVLETFTGLSFDLQKCEDMVESLVDLAEDDQITLERDPKLDVGYSLTAEGEALADHIHKGGDPADFVPPQSKMVTTVLATPVDSCNCPKCHMHKEGTLG